MEQHTTSLPKINTRKYNMLISKGLEALSGSNSRRSVDKNILKKINMQFDEPSKGLEERGI
jgi:hypothetical protein